MKSLLRRVLTFLDDQTSTVLDRHLELAIPSQKTSSPDAIVARFLPSRSQVEQIGTFSCCTCCLQPGFECNRVHRSPCDRTLCGQTWRDGGLA